MSKTRHAALAATALCGLLAAGAAQADVIYTFTTTDATNSRTGQYFPVSLSFDLANAAVDQGSFSLTARGSGANPFLSGDVGDFTSLTFDTGTQGSNDFDSYTITPTLSYGGGTTDLTFNGSGDVTSTSINDVFFTNEVHLSGTGTTASGYGASDANVCFNSANGPTCSVTGIWTHSTYTPASNVPEPASLAVLGAGLLGMVARRRRS